MTHINFRDLRHVPEVVIDIGDNRWGSRSYWHSDPVRALRHVERLRRRLMSGDWRKLPRGRYQRIELWMLNAEGLRNALVFTIEAHTEETALELAQGFIFRTIHGRSFQGA